MELNDIEAARVRIGDQIELTPCAHSEILSALTGAEIFLKFENL